MAPGHPQENQDYTVEGSEAATNTVSGSGDDANRGARRYSVSGLEDGSYDVFLFPAENVSMDENGVVSFEDSAENAGDGNNVADWTATNGVVEVVNGTSTGDINGTVLGISPVNGNINFTIDSETADEVVPVVVAADGTNRTDTNPDLDLDAADQPTEAFGVGGQKTWLPAEATVGQPQGGDVVDISTAEDFYTLDEDGDGTADVRINYVSGDDFSYDSGTFTNVSISMAQFEEWLSEGDTISIATYNPGGTEFGVAKSDHTIEVDIPAAPTGLTAAEDTDGNIDLDWDAPSNPDVASYTIQRATKNAQGTWVWDNSYDSVAGKNNTAYEDAEAAVTDGETYRYRVVAVNTNGDESAASNVVEVTASQAADQTKPTITAADLTTDNGAGGTGGEDYVMNTGDQIRFQFSEAVVLASDATLAFTDQDGTQAEVTRGSNATFTQSQNGQTVLVTLTGNPVVTDFTTDLQLEYPADLNSFSGVQDEAGNDLDYTDGDVTIGSAPPA